MKQLYFLLLMTLVSVNGLHAECDDSRYKDPIFSTVTVRKDIKFGNNTNSKGESQDLLLDIYTPPAEDTVQLRPLIFFVHGGSYIGGDKDDHTIKMMATEMAKRGYVGVSVQYRLQQSDVEGLDPILAFADKNNWYKSIGRGVQDVKAAIRFIKQGVATEGNIYQVDTNNIILYGSSAGAITILHTAYMTDLNQATDAMKNAITQIGGLEGESGNPGYASTNTVRALVSCSGALADDQWVANRKDLSLLAFHHNNDPSVPFRAGCFYTAFCHLGRFHGSYRLANKAEELGVHYELNVIDGVDHPADDKQPQLVLDRMVPFLYDLQCQYDPSMPPVATGIIRWEMQALSVYPNPSRGDISVAFPSTWNSADNLLEVIRIDGQLVRSQRISGNPGTLSLKLDLESGLYLVRITSINNDEREPLIGKIMIVK